MAVQLREDYAASALRQLAARAKDVNQSRRLLSLAAVRDGRKRTEAARIGGMDRQTLRDWVHRLNALGPEGLPSRAPELNPVEYIWQLLRANKLSNRVFNTYDAIIDAACDAWNWLIDQPQTSTSIGLRNWAYTGRL